ncbi:unnamed protein product [Lupinus luteus]|uniref:Mei2-like C-terminal RNA recognition motif domain-containing protein n=1 Tax=Lupinus luteus TaxID=3873 RepID=A0AAV1X1W4_LUPLU
MASRPLNPNAQPFYPPTILHGHHISAASTNQNITRGGRNRAKFNDLLKILDEHCFELNKTAKDAAAYSKFDFLYLPMDFRRHAIDKKLSNLGYAFVNFTSPTAAFKFYKRFNGFIWNVTTNRKTCEINAAQYQGVDALIRKFREKIFRCKRSDFLPFVFWEYRDGFNSQVVGTTVGKHVWGLPRKS